MTPASHAGGPEFEPRCPYTYIPLSFHIFSHFSTLSHFISLVSRGLKGKRSVFYERAWSSGYDVCLTRRRSRVRSSVPIEKMEGREMGLLFRKGWFTRRIFSTVLLFVIADAFDVEWKLAEVCVDDFSGVSYIWVIIHWRITDPTDYTIRLDYYLN
eukprot:XP_762956.1 hypothetical protein [Theileria parva strain Muguga]